MKTVRSGLITARLEVTAAGGVLHAPLAFDEEIVLETGTRRLACNPADEAALEREVEDFYLDSYAAWVARGRQEADAVSGPDMPRVAGPRPHQPDPALWAGR